jgi:hypothetical protein
MLSQVERPPSRSFARREKCSVWQVNMTISLAFLAPNLVIAAVEGRLPAASASSGSAIRLVNGADSLRRSDSIRNNCSAGLRSTKLAAIQNQMRTFAKQEFEWQARHLLIIAKADELAAFLLFSKCRRGFLLRGFRDPPLPATPVRLGSRTLRPVRLAGGSVPRVREHVVGSDLLLAYPLCVSSKHSLPWGACRGRKGEAVQAANVGTTR